MNRERLIAGGLDRRFASWIKLRFRGGRLVMKSFLSSCTTGLLIERIASNEDYESKGSLCPILSRLVARYFSLCSFTGGKIGT